MHIFNVNLAEEKKTIIRNITEWIKLKCKNTEVNQEIAEKIISCQSVFVSLLSNKDNLRMSQKMNVKYMNSKIIICKL